MLRKSLYFTRAVGGFPSFRTYCWGGVSELASDVCAWRLLTSCHVLSGAEA